MRILKSVNQTVSQSTKMWDFIVGLHWLKNKKGCVQIMEIKCMADRKATCQTVCRTQTVLELLPLSQFLYTLEIIAFNARPDFGEN